MSGHTPAPWHKAPRVGEVRSPDNRLIADAYGVSAIQADANARLIAAAPELFEAAKKTEGVLYAALGAWLDDNNALPFNSLERLIHDVRCAIAKAEDHQ